MNWRLPAEWEEQAYVWLVWPRDPLTWPDGRIEGARAAYATAIAAIAPQPVRLIVHPDLLEALPADVAAASHVDVIPCAHQDSWIRDYGVLTLVDDAGNKQPTKFQFDAWGGKYEPLKADNDVVHRLVELGYQEPVDEIDFVLEGGAVETDGQGTFLATQSVAEEREQTEEEHEDALAEGLGAQVVIWLGDGITGDDTDGHIDTITRFVAPGKVVTTVAPKGHRDHDVLAENLRRLQEAEDAKGRSLEILELPVPEDQTTTQGDLLPAGYANFLITNHAVLVPSYDCPQDQEAQDVLAGCFPGRRIVAIDHRDLIWGFGGIHCLSMHVPA